MTLRLILIIIVAFSIGGVGALALRGMGTSGSGQSGKVLIGGSFNLTNHEGKAVTDRDFRGKYMLVEFGYTYCPDVCPAELNTISEALNKLGKKGEAVTPVFITIDPERDTAEQLKLYISNFHPRIVGLTGTPEQIKQAASAYRVYYAKSSEPSDKENYLMDHSTFLYLMDPSGAYVTHFGYGISSDDLAKRIAEAIGDPSV